MDPKLKLTCQCIAASALNDDRREFVRLAAAQVRTFLEGSKTLPHLCQTGTIYEIVRSFGTVLAAAIVTEKRAERLDLADAWDEISDLLLSTFLEELALGERLTSDVEKRKSS